MSPVTLPRPSRQPQSVAEWRTAATRAAALLAIDDTRRLGVLRGGPRIDRAQCLGVLASAAEHHVEPDEDPVVDALSQILDGWNGEAVDLDA